MHSRCIAHRSGRGLDKSRIQAYRWRRVYRRATGGCDGSTAGHWASSNAAFTISRRRCGTKPYTSSGSSRFPTMLLSLPPFGLRSGGRLEVICPELRPSRMAIHSMRRMAHTFTAPRSPSVGPPEFCADDREGTASAGWGACDASFGAIMANRGNTGNPRQSFRDILTRPQRSKVWRLERSFGSGAVGAGPV
jgi:hypothetical protein